MTMTDRRGIVLIDLDAAATDPLSALLPDGTIVIGVDVGRCSSDELAIVVEHPGLPVVPDDMFPPLVEVQTVELLGWRLPGGEWTPLGVDLDVEVHGEYGSFGATLEGDSMYDLRRGAVKPACACGHSPEGHETQNLSGLPLGASTVCTVRGCGCSRSPFPPAFPGFAGEADR